MTAMTAEEKITKFASLQAKLQLVKSNYKTEKDALKKKHETEMDALKKKHETKWKKSKPNTTNLARKCWTRCKRYSRSTQQRCSKQRPTQHISRLWPFRRYHRIPFRRFSWSRDDQSVEHEHELGRRLRLCFCRYFLLLFLEFLVEFQQRESTPIFFGVPEIVVNS